MNSPAAQAWHVELWSVACWANCSLDFSFLGYFPSHMQSTFSTSYSISCVYHGVQFQICVSVCLFSISASFSGYVQYVTVLCIRYVCACSFVSRVQKVVQDSFFTRTSCVFHHDLFFSRFCPSSEPIPRFHPRRLQFWRRSIWRPRRERTK